MKEITIPIDTLTKLLDAIFPMFNATIDSVASPGMVSSDQIKTLATVYNEAKTILLTQQ